MCNSVGFYALLALEPSIQIFFLISLKTNVFFAKAMANVSGQLAQLVRLTLIMRIKCTELWDLGLN